MGTHRIEERAGSKVGEGLPEPTGRCPTGGWVVPRDGLDERQPPGYEIQFWKDDDIITLLRFIYRACKPAYSCGRGCGVSSAH